jgi:AraC-like DNA-binding protein
MSLPGIYIYRRIVKARLYIDAHYAENLNLDMIAGEASFSKFHFIRLFRKIYQCTPHQHLKEVRLAKAKELLSTGMLVSDVCLQVGFESHGSFALAFKQKFATNPSEFQLAQKQRLASIARRPFHYIPGCFAKTASSH